MWMRSPGYHIQTNGLVTRDENVQHFYFKANALRFSPFAPSHHFYNVLASVPAHEIERFTHTAHSIDLKFNDFISFFIHTYGNWAATHSKFIFTIAIQIEPNDWIKLLCAILSFDVRYVFFLFTFLSIIWQR